MLAVDFAASIRHSATKELVSSGEAPFLIHCAFDSIGNSSSARVAKDAIKKYWGDLREWALSCNIKYLLLMIF
jgi:hypothetical protein